LLCLLDCVICLCCVVLWCWVVCSVGCSCSAGIITMAAGNEWIYGYLEAILDTGERINDIRRQSVGEKDSFKAAKYFVDEVTGFDESSLYRTWIKVVATIVVFVVVAVCPSTLCPSSMLPFRLPLSSRSLLLDCKWEGPLDAKKKKKKNCCKGHLNEIHVWGRWIS
jgi:hypothetical protein